jgi:hypothetical protein
MFPLHGFIFNVLFNACALFYLCGSEGLIHHFFNLEAKEFLVIRVSLVKVEKSL